MFSTIDRKASTLLPLDVYLARSIKLRNSTALYFALAVLHSDAVAFELAGEKLGRVGRCSCYSPWFLNRSIQQSPEAGGGAVHEVHE